MLTTMLWLMLGLWLFGILGGYTAGGLIHILALVAAAVALYRFIQRRKAF